MTKVTLECVVVAIRLFWAKPGGNARVTKDVEQIMNVRRVTTIFLGAVVVVACGQSAEGPVSSDENSTTAPEGQTSTTAATYDPALMTVVESARADLANRLDVEESSVQVAVAESVTWSDGSLGCPQPGMFYTQALVDGSRVVLEHGGRFFAYHTGLDEKPFLCESEADDGGHDSVPSPEGTVPSQRDTS